MRTIIAGLVGLVLLLVAVAQVASDGSWEADLGALLCAFGVWVAMVFSETFAELSGSYGWTRKTWRTDPEWYVKLMGAVMLIGGANDILEFL